MSKELTIAVRDFIALDRFVKDYQTQDLSISTRIKYSEDWQSLCNFMVPRDAWKAEPMDIAHWIAWLAQRGVAVTTIKTRLTSVNYIYERAGKGAAHGRIGKGTRVSPCRDLLVKQTMRGILRRHGRPPEKKIPLMLESLEKMIDEQPETLYGIRNRALLVLGWGAALRVRELSRLDITSGGLGDGWIEIHDDGVMVNLRRSKANPHRRKLEQYAVPARPSAPRYCPVKLLRRWLEVSKATSGPLFTNCGGPVAPLTRRLDCRAIRKAVKNTAVEIGFDWNTVGGQSLRSGCLTWLSMQGVNPYRVQEHSGHTSLRSLLDYIRLPKTPRGSPLAETIWAR